MGSLIRLLSWFIPVPFMILYHVKSKKLEGFLTLVVPYSCLVFLALFFCSLFSQIPALGFQVSLISFYLAACSFSFLIFYSNYSAPQALGIAVCLTFFASMYWEIPYYIYTIYLRGYIDQAMPLHLLPLFPFAFVISKIEVRVDWRNFLLIASNMFVSTLSIFFLLSIGSDIFWTYNNPTSLQFVVEITWFLVRTFCLITLYWIYYHGRLRSERINAEPKI